MPATHGVDDGEIPVITTEDSIRFLNDCRRCRIVTDIRNYCLDDLRYEDTVIDIGANAGAFALRAKRYSHHVVAVEPVTYELLEKNIGLNNAVIPVIRGALGDGNPTLIRWDDLEQIAPTFTLKDLKEVAGGCNFLKCDCEGAEWLINPDHLEGVRRIEMELHLPPIGPEVNPALLEYIADNYTFTLDRIPSHGPLGLLGHLHAFRKA